MGRKGTHFVLVVVLGLFLIYSSCKGKKEESSITASPLPDTAFFVEFKESKIPTTFKPGESRKVPITIINLGDVPWPHRPAPSGGYEVNLGHDWIDDKANMIMGDRTHLPFDLLPGDQVTLEANVRAPEKPGKYKIKFQMVQERVAWFTDNKGADGLIAEVRVKDAKPKNKKERKKGK